MRRLEEKTLRLYAVTDQAGDDYIGCGAVFGSSTKGDVTLLSLKELKEICKTVKIPVVAIGGITIQNAGQLTGIGIAGMAVVSALFASENKREAVKQLFIKDYREKV